MNNIKLIKDDNEKEKDIIYRNKINNIINNNMCKSISDKMREDKRKKLNTPLIDKHNYKTKENKLDINQYNNYSPTSIRDKLILSSKNKEMVELPSLKAVYNKSPEINKIFAKNKIIYNNSNESPSTSAFTNSTKKNINGQNLTEQMSKYRMGLLSANSSSNNNNNPIIPMLPIKRPVSNFNFGGNQLWENDTNNNSPKEINNKIIFDLKAINKCPNQLNKNITIKNRNIAKSFDIKGKSSNIIKSNKKIEELNNNNNINNIIKPKLHKIKIEKGMMNNKFMDIFNKQLNDNKNPYIFNMKFGIKSLSVKKK